MSPKALTDRLYVSPQLSLADVDAAAAEGFRAIINNRPDGEEPGQPTSAELAARAATKGLSYTHIPIVPGKFASSDVAAFSDALAQADGKVVAFCRTGTRAATLWALDQAGLMAPDTIIAAASAAGYDLSGLRPKLMQSAQR
jgi:sulfide:quinone oxidoreductase